MRRLAQRRLSGPVSNTSAPGRNRTCYLMLRRHALYPVSYRRASFELVTATSRAWAWRQACDVRSKSGPSLPGGCAGAFPARIPCAWASGQPTCSKPRGAVKRTKTKARPRKRAWPRCTASSSDQRSLIGVVGGRESRTPYASAARFQSTPAMPCRAVTLAAMPRSSAVSPEPVTEVPQELRSHRP
jgi:hypothetical protein